MQFAVESNTNGKNPGAPYRYTAFIPEGYKTAKPECTGVVSNLNGISYGTPSAVTIYSQCTRSSSDYFVINHRGYIYAQTSGAYTFTAPNTDDWLGIWVGGKAYSGWMRTNADLDLVYETTPNNVNITLVAGQYYAFRIMYANGGGGAYFSMTVKDPTGTAIPSADLVQYSCDGVLAPKYAAFGSET